MSKLMYSTGTYKISRMVESPFSPPLFLSSSLSLLSLSLSLSAHLLWVSSRSLCVALSLHSPYLSDPSNDRDLQGIKGQRTHSNSNSHLSWYTYTPFMLQFTYTWLVVSQYMGYGSLLRRGNSDTFGTILHIQAYSHRCVSYSILSIVFQITLIKLVHSWSIEHGFLSAAYCYPNQALTPEHSYHGWWLELICCPLYSMVILLVVNLLSFAWQYTPYAWTCCMHMYTYHIFVSLREGEKERERERETLPASSEAAHAWSFLSGIFWASCMAGLTMSIVSY